MLMYRIGFSEDIHPVKEGRKLILGGVDIPSSFGLDGHSDADVVTHAVAESVLGALALGDLGTHFPDNDPQYKNISSFILLDKVVEMMFEKGFIVNNIDIQIACYQPKLSSYIEAMRNNLAKALKTDVKNVSVKAMSFNKVGAIGKGEAIRAQSCVLLANK